MSKVDQKIKNRASVRDDMYEDHKSRGFNRKERREHKRTWFEGQDVEKKANEEARVAHG